MNSQSNGRSQRPKGKRVKLAFQIGSVLAVCLWMLYQAKQSHGTGYSGSVHNEVMKKQGSGILGRKVTVGGSNLVGEGVNDEVRGGGVDVSDVNVEEKDKELSNADDNSDIELKENSEENSLREGNSQVGHEQALSTMSDQNGEKDVESTSHHEVGEDKDEMSHVSLDEQGNGSDAQKESVTKDLSSENEFIVQPTERKNDSLPDHNLMADGVHGFDDETGVPVDGNNITESRVTESNGDGEISLREEVVARGVHASFEARSKISEQDSEPEAETDSETGNRVDTSRINSMNVTTQGGTSVSDL